MWTQTTSRQLRAPGVELHSCQGIGLVDARLCLPPASESVSAGGQSVGLSTPTLQPIEE